MASSNRQRNSASKNKQNKQQSPQTNKQQNESKNKTEKKQTNTPKETKKFTKTVGFHKAQNRAYSVSLPDKQASWYL